VRRELQSVAKAANGVDRLTRAVLRAALVERLTALQVHGPAAVADAALPAPARSAIAGQGRLITLVPLEPSSAPVDGAALLDTLVQTIREYVVMTLDAVRAIALLVVNAHLYDAMEIGPYGVVNSPVKRCGKTTLLIVISCLTPKPLLTSNATEAAMFRAIEEHSPTLIIDEADTFAALKPETRGILNAGHTRRTAYVLRTVGDDHEPRLFSVWCPKFVGLIGTLPDTLMDRSVVVSLRRRKRDEPFTRLRADRIDATLAPLAQQVARWAADHMAAVRDADPEVPRDLNDRQADNWRPLLAIADEVGGAWPDQARAAAKALSGVEQLEEDDIAVAALQDVGALLKAAAEHRMSSAELVSKLTEDETGRWAEYSKDKPLTQRQLARLLARSTSSPSNSRSLTRTSAATS
jgi:putative DNA primase/helicase